LNVFKLSIILTGRRHQIRRHLAHNALQILGDTTYGKGKINQFFQSTHGLNRLCLHACYLEFVHPITKATVKVQDRLPDDFRGFLANLPEPPNSDILESL